jgi:hypothetical protein
MTSSEILNLHIFSVHFEAVSSLANTAPRLYRVKSSVSVKNVKIHGNAPRNNCNLFFYSKIVHRLVLLFIINQFLRFLRTESEQGIFGYDSILKTDSDLLMCQIQI